MADGTGLMTASEPARPTVEVPAAVTFDDVYRHVHGDYYVSRRASYDIPAIVAQLAQEHPGAELDDVNPDVLWDILEAHIACLHSPIAGMMVVHEEDLLTVAEGGQRVECEHCERVFNADVKLWVKL